MSCTEIETLKLMAPEQFRSYFLNNYEIYKKNPPALAISTVTKNDNNKPLSLNMCGMFAKEKISKGSIISEYTGEIKPDSYANSFFSQVDDTYLLGVHPVVDSIKYRSATSMSNHGFPNSQLLSLGKGDLDQGLDGLPFRHVLVAIDDIAEGEEIIWNYGAHYPSSGFSEPRPNGLEQFLKNTSWKEIIQALKEFGSTEIAKENLIDIFNKVYKFKYFVESPQAMKFAIEHKYLEKKHLRLLEKASNNDSFPPLSRALLTQFVERAKSQFKNKREL
ncbi:MAG: hypothetical protein K2Y01_04180 [Rhabdochlamydiaceae bacterium]|nr:hypothetical protein [Rhabdochlamydiaceae bacterium]